MPTPITDFTDLNLLRQTAEASLKQGTTPPTKGWSISPDALSLLYKLASTPENASDALKLLHELQAHQVELDLQHEQLKSNEQEAAAEHERYRALFERAPFGYFVVGIDGHIIEANLNGARVFGVEHADFWGDSIHSFLAPESHHVLNELLMSLSDGDVASCLVNTINNAGESRQLHIIANSEPGDEVVLLAIIELIQ